jgi:hypothetical protein
LSYQFSAFPSESLGIARLSVCARRSQLRQFELVRSEIKQVVKFPLVPPVTTVFRTGTGGYYSDGADRTAVLVG